MADYDYTTLLAAIDEWDTATETGLSKRAMTGLANHLWSAVLDLIVEARDKGQQEAGATTRREIGEEVGWSYRHPNTMPRTIAALERAGLDVGLIWTGGGHGESMIGTPEWWVNEDSSRYDANAARRLAGRSVWVRIDSPDELIPE